MEEIFSLLSTSPLFSNIPTAELAPFVKWLAPVQKQYTKGQTVILCGSSTNEFGVLLEGELEGIKPLLDGRRLPVGHFVPGNVFGDVLAFSSQGSPVTITALKNSRVLSFSSFLLQKPNCPVPTAQAIFTQNLFGLISSKYFDLNRRLDLLLIKSLRSRISAFLLGEAQLAKSNTFCIRFNRVQLAEYLCCDRSALCREISRMKQEGILESYRGSFRLLAPDKLSAADSFCEKPLR